MTDDETRARRLRDLDDRLIEFALSRRDVESIVVASGEALHALGVALGEIRLGARTLHPEIDAIGVTWSAERGPDSGVWRHDDGGHETWLTSPLYFMLSGDVRRLHRPLYTNDCPLDFPVLAEFRAEGITDYLAQLIPIGERRLERPEGFILRWLSLEPGGFSADDLAVLDRIAPRIAAACEPGLERQIAGNLLNAYLGPRSGRAVLDGSVQPGRTQSLEAVILVADLSGFTAASDTMDGERLVAFLDRHLEAMVPPVEAGGGEILAFLGDGFLAAFDVAGDPAGACTRAAAAARTILARVEALRKDDTAVLPVDIALHIGTVRYGNVGAGGRQAFTVIGPAVNLASRIEALCGALGHQILLSEAVARFLDPTTVRDIGAHPIRGHVTKVKLFSLI